MAVLSRVNWVAQQRMDLSHVLAMESFNAFDFRALLTFFTGSEKALIARGFEVVGKTGLSVNIRVSDSFVLNPLDNNGSFYRGETDDADVILELPAEQSNIFVEARFINETAAPVNTSFWNPLSLTGDDVAGTEFSASTNSQNIIKIEISANTVGFSEGSVKLFTAKTSASAITELKDARESIFRLATGGVTPDPSHKFPWAAGRTEPVVAGAGVDQALDSSFRNRDATGILNDKGIKNYKEWMDAVMTRIAEIAGAPGSPWYTNGIAQNTVTGLNINTLFFDSDSGHGMMASHDASIMWSQEGDNILRSQGTIPTEWRANYVAMEWTLGGTFVSNIPGGSRAYTEVKWESPVIPDGSSLYLLLERDVPKASGNAVSWADNSADPGNLTQNQAVSGVSGDFTGLAIGDFIRKSSEGYSRYYRIAKLSNGSTAFTTADLIADNTIVALELEEVIASGVGNEPFKYFRSRYGQSDLVVEPSGLHPYQDINYYWIGRRNGTLLNLRNYGIMQPGEETNTIEDSFQLGTGTNDLVLEHQENVVYDGTDYFLEGGPGLVLKIYRRKRDNTVHTPGGGDNSGALLEYTITGDITIAPGQQLWVKLDDTTGGALSPGSVDENLTDDEDNTNTVTNVYEILDPADAPLRNFDNRDVYLVARAVTSPSTVNTNQLIFLDGTVLGFRGHYINNRMAVSGDTSFYHDNVRLIQRPEESVLFIDENPVNDRRIDDDVANFFYQKIAQIHGVFNYRWGVNTLTLATPADVDWLSNLGSNTLYLGSDDSTVRIRGNLQVDGATVSIQTQTIQIDDKRITLGVGNVVGTDVTSSGFEIAQGTKEVDTASTVSGQQYVELDYGVAHGYSIGDTIGVSANINVDGITSGEITGEYLIVAGAPAPGEAQFISANILQIRTTTTASSTTSVVLAPPVTSIRSFISTMWMKASNADGAFSSSARSWAFKVFNVTQVVTLTPINGYGCVPTASHTTMSNTRIPFTGNDNSGQGGSDSTLDFTANLTWDNGTNTLAVTGTFVMTGDILPGADNVYDIGSSSLRWAEMHGGPVGFISHGDATNTLYGRLRYSAGAILDTDAASTLRLTTGANNGILINTNGSVHINQSVGIGSTAPSGTSIVRIGQTSPNLSGTTHFGILMDFRGTALSDSMCGLRIDLTTTDHVAPTNVPTTGIDLIDPVAGVNTTITSHKSLNLRGGGAIAGVSSLYQIYSEQNNATDYWFMHHTGTAYSYSNGRLSLGDSVQANIISRLHFVAGTTAADGISFGTDTNLYRSAANELKTDDSLRIGQSLRYDSQVSVTGNTTLLVTDLLAKIDTTAAVADITVTLPAISAVNKGQLLILKDVGGQVDLLNKRVFVDGTGTDTIDGSTTALLMDIPYFALMLISDGVSNWMIV